MKNYKSFRIDDILVNTTEKSDKNEKYSSSSESQNANETISEEAFRPRYFSENKELSRMDSEKVKWKLEKEAFYSPVRESPTLNEEISKLHRDIPGYCPFPLSQVTSENEGKLQSYSNIFPYYSVDQALRISQNRSLLKHYANPSQILTFPPFSSYQRGEYPSANIGYAISYPGVSGQYGIPIGNVTVHREPLFEKGLYPHDKGHYSMFALARPMYSSTCKRKGGQIRFNNSQTGQLEKAFVHQKYLNASERKKLAQDLGLTDRQIKTWFQNRRAKLRKSKGPHCSDVEMPGSPDDQNIEVSSHYVDSP